MSITLHPTQGVNAHLTFCPRCGGEGAEIMLIGNRTTIRECAQCKAKLYGHGSGEPCGRCKSRGPHAKIGRIEEHDKLPGTIPCDKCQAEIKEHNAIIDKGGIFFRCLECKQAGVIKPDRFTKAVRKRMKIPTGPCGVEFDKCSEHATS